MRGSKVINDSVHGSVRIGGLHLDLLERPEMQRLHGVHQLGMAHLVFPGANHARIEHCLGTYHLAGAMASALELSGDDRRTVQAAALLHDIGHSPYSHTLEAVLVNRTGRDHADVAEDLVLGRLPSMSRQDEAILGPLPPISELLEADGIDPEAVAGLITSSHSGPLQATLATEGGQAHFGSDSYLMQMISGPLDVDQMDYLMRDSHYTGVAHGAIDIDRLMQTVALFHGGLVISKGGLVAAEGLMVARALMYTAVYFHKTSRIAEMMLCKAAEIAPDDVLKDAHLATDGSLDAALMGCGGEPAELMALLRHRRLYKKAFMVPAADLDDEQARTLQSLTDYRRRRAMEDEIADRCGIPSSKVLLDVPDKHLLLGGLSRGKTDVPVLQGDRVRPLSKYSPLAHAIQYRGVLDWAVMASAPAEHVEAVGRAARKALFS